VVADGAGNGVAVGLIHHTAAEWSDFVVAKLDGGTGAELWRTVFSGSPDYYYNGGTAVVVDDAGDVIAAGFTGPRFGPYDAIALKLSGATGARGVDGEQVYPSRKRPFVSAVFLYSPARTARTGELLHVASSSSVAPMVAPGG